MPTLFERRPRRLVSLLAASLAVLALAAPALAVDTGGPGDTTPAPALHVKAPAAMKMSATAPKVHVIALDDARTLIAKSDWTAAVKLLRKIVVQQPKNADALNLLGYSLRREGDMKEAEAFYLKALKLDPNHLGANEYLGELYVMTGQTAKAQARLAVLAKACGNTTCEEYQDLAQAIAAKA
jgi:Flp pilus assembly protein TadD